MATCRGPNCGAEILWANSRKYVTEAGHHRGGKSVPLDPEPNPDGNIVLEPGDDGRPVAVVLANDAAERYTGEKYMPHWKTCPDRDRFRSGGTLRLVILLLSLLSLACVSSKAESFEWWTRKYEIRMGLDERAEIRIGPTGTGACGRVGYRVQEGRYGQESRLVVSYDPKMKGCQSPWEIALHEACHRRMQHHHITITRPDAEAEVAKCMEWYR